MVLILSIFMHTSTMAIRKVPRLTSEYVLSLYFAK